ncbi:MAG: hypothetical protein ACFHWX_21785 [Bacteroidota bacterium]
MAHRIITFTFLLIVFQGMAHVPNETYAQISVRKGQINFIIELPWSFRNALIAYDRELAHAETKEQFEKTALAYFRENIILKDGTRKLELVSLSEIPNAGHSHQITFQLLFDGDNVSTIENQILFNTYNQVINYHTLFLGDQEITFQTSKAMPVYHLPGVQSRIIWYLIGADLALILTFLLMRRKYLNT